MDKLDTIGKRAVWAIEERCVQTRTRKGKEFANLSVESSKVSNWRCGRNDPDAFALQQMALAGYDIHWILTGVKAYGTA